MKLATLNALLQGDIENAIIAETPGGIEAQEARGQQDFVASETLPKKCILCTREQLEEMGIVFGDNVDNLFIKVTLPTGWKKAPTDHSMWSHLTDEYGRERAKIFYKAAFYDRRAHIGLTRRFQYSVEPVSGWDDPDYQQHEWHCVIKDANEIVWVSDERVEAEPDCPHGDEGKRRLWLDWCDRKDKLGSLGRDWLDKHYPDWENPLAYWQEND